MKQFSAWHVKRKKVQHWGSKKKKNNGNICWQTSISQYKGLAKRIERSNATDTDAKSAKNKETHRVQVQGQLGLDIGGKQESIFCNGSFHFPSFSPFIVGSDATTPCRWHWWLGTSDDKKWRVEWIVTKYGPTPFGAFSRAKDPSKYSVSKNILFLSRTSALAAWPLLDSAGTCDTTTNLNKA